MALGFAFIPYYKHLMEILETNKEMKKSATGIFKQMGCAAGGAAAGGILGGPPGALIGGIVGSFMGYMIVDDYQSMVKVLRNLSDEEKKKVVMKVQELVGNVGVEELVRFVGTQVHREALLQLLRKMTSELKGG